MRSLWGQRSPRINFSLNFNFKQNSEKLSDKSLLCIHLVGVQQLLLKNQKWDMWHATFDTWHVTCETWHETHGGRWTFCNNFRSLAHTVWEWRLSENLEENHQSVNEWINHKSVCRTAPATPGLFTIDIILSPVCLHNSLCDEADWARRGN